MENNKTRTRITESTNGQRINPIILPLGGEDCEIWREDYPRFYDYAYANTPLAIRHVESILAVERKNGRKFGAFSAVRILDSDL